MIYRPLKARQLAHCENFAAIHFGWYKRYVLDQCRNCENEARGLREARPIPFPTSCRPLPSYIIEIYSLARLPQAHHARPAPDAFNLGEATFFVTIRSLPDEMTGMPAFGPTHSDERLWTIVGFLKQLPQLSPEKYAEMKHVSEKQHVDGHDEHTHPQRSWRRSDKISTADMPRTQCALEPENGGSTTQT